jgi:hypothetical protein
MYEEDYEPNPRHKVAAATTSYTVDNNWYANSGATNHITSELDKLAVRDKYTGTEKVHTTSGAGIEISDTSKYFIHTPSHTLELCNILHVSKATKNLMSIHPFTLDNNVFFEFTIGSLHTRSTLLKGRCHDCLYPIPTSYFAKFAFGVNKLSLAR